MKCHNSFILKGKSYFVWLDNYRNEQILLICTAQAWFYKHYLKNN